jgi:oligoendopeptidase F
MNIEWEGQTMTLPQASVLLKDTDRNKRAEVYALIQHRRLLDKEKFDVLFNELIALRHKVALNAGFENYRDYKFVEMCRFSYSEKDCFAFHDAIQKETVPIIEQIDERRKQKLGLSSLKPYDAQVDLTGKPALKPFVDSNDLIRKTIQCYNEIDPYFGSCIEIMSEMSYLDLDSRQGKAPGGFNYPLYEIGVPFIYMNSAGTIRDLVTMVHEGGHAIHSFLSRGLELTAFKELTSEIAELASMSMELISMEHWHVFFNDEAEYKRAKCEQLEQVIETLPWVAQIDKFQHWIYENPGHTSLEREDYWEELMNQFGSSVVDWSGLEKEKRNLWQKQLHLFEVPFYYIEYGMAQLGAIAIWRNYKKDPKPAIEKYKKALSLGYTKSISEVYSAAGIEFNFTQKYVKDLMDFVRAELEKLQD